MARILVVDDNPNNLRLATYMLKLLGHESLEAETCQIAYREARRHHPDMLLLDLNMPHGDTLEFVEQLRNDPDFRDVPIALCTATATAETRERALRKGFPEEIPKPYDLEVFRHDITAFLTSHCEHQEQP